MYWLSYPSSVHCWYNIQVRILSILVFWVLTPCGLVGRCQCFWGIYCPPSSGLKTTRRYNPKTDIDIFTALRASNVSSSYCILPLSLYWHFYLIPECGSVAGCSVRWREVYSLRLPYEIRQIVMALWTLLSQLVLLLLCLYNKDNNAKSLHPVDLLYTVASPAVIHITLD
jgi:hypothetical protein